jgi:1,4-alpha-glucan branching enzyme
MITVRFFFHTGIRRPLFSQVTLGGSWDNGGKFSGNWTDRPMQEITLPDGSLSYRTTVDFDDGEAGKFFEWGVRADGPGGNAQWMIAAEAKDWKRNDRVREFTLSSSGQQEEYYLTHLSYLGSNIQKAAGPDSVRFAVWAPNAQEVWLVLGDPASGYIGDSGEGVIERHRMRPVKGGVWETTITVKNVDNTIYLYEIRNDAGRTVYRTDLYSRCQVGSGDRDPKGAQYAGTPIDLDGRVSCSYVVDPAKIEHPISSNPIDRPSYVTEADFWKDEFDPQRPLPKRLEDLVIYELHVGALAFGQNRPGNIADAVALIPYLQELGVNAVELLPIQEYSGKIGWGYGTTHFCAIEFSSGGPDHLKTFVRACHRQGIAVIVDVVYNHYPPEADRAEWMYDTVSHEKNCYYWYEGKQADYGIPEGGYIDNLSTGFAPAFHDEMVRKLFTSSAVSLMLDFHIDGFRADQTTSIHSYPVIHADGTEASQARIFGAKFLREWVRTLRLVRPNAFLIAEDHSLWPEVTKPSDSGGIGFNATWYNDFYHHLIGDTHRTPNLIISAGYGGNWPLDMSYFGGLMAQTNGTKIVFHESHDECGNSQNDGRRSCRTIMAAVHKEDPAELTAMLRGYAEGRSRFAAGMALLSAGVPMFFMGEEIGAAKCYRHDTWLDNREDLRGAKADSGADLFRFYGDLIRLRMRIPALRSSKFRVLHVHNANRVIAFKRGDGDSEALVLATLSNDPYAGGYTISHPDLWDASWREVFSSDASQYGGISYGNSGATLFSRNGSFHAVIPPNGFVVFERV